METRELSYWLALGMIKGLGAVAIRRLLEAFDHPRMIFEASVADLKERAGLGSEAAKAIREFRDRDKIRTELNKMLEHHASLISFRDPEYPFWLKQITDPPPYLYCVGRLETTDQNAIAVVGSRIASDYGKKITREIVRGVVARGITVVSGMARGIDAEAHSAALDSGGRTLAVLGSGVDVVYPPEHGDLYTRIRAKGAILSELAMGIPPVPWNFPNRNRLISGLCLGTLVVEATERSGSLITARLALDQGREVFAVPGNVGSSRSRGTNRLIKNGAKLVERVEDVLEEIAVHVSRETSAGRPDLPALDPKEVKILDALGTVSVHVDEIILKTGMSAALVLDSLLRLELLGLVEQLPGKRFLVK